MDGVDVWECFGRSLEVWSQQMMNSAGGEEEREGESAERVYSEDRRIWCQIGRRYDEKKNRQKYCLQAWRAGLIAEYLHKDWSSL